MMLKRNLVVIIMLSMAFPALCQDWKDQFDYVNDKVFAGRQLVKHEGKWGYLDENHKVVGSIKYASAEYFDEATKTAVVQVKDASGYKYGVIDINGKYIIPLVKFNLTRWHDDLFIHDIVTTMKIINLKNEVLLEDDLEEIEKYDKKKEYTLISKNKKHSYTRLYGLIDKDGKLAVPPVFEREVEVAGYNKKFKMVRGYCWYEGKRVQRIYHISKGWLTNTNYDRLGVFNDEGKCNVRLGSKTGYVDQFGKEHWTGTEEKYAVDDIINAGFDDKGEEVNGFIKVKKDGKFGFVNKAGKLVVPCEYDVAHNFTKDKTSYVKKGGKCGVINSSNQEIIPIKFSEIYKESENIRIVKLGSLYGYYTASGEKISDPIYSKANNFKNGMARVEKGSKAGFINKQNKLVVPLKYDFVGSGFNDGLLAVKNSGKAGYINFEGVEVIPLKFAQGSSFYEGQAIVKEVGSNFFSAINIKGEITVTFEKDLQELYPTKSSENYIFKRNDKYGVISSLYGELVVTNCFTKINSRLADGKTVVYIKKGMGLLDAFGNLIIPPIYDNIWQQKRGFYTVKKGKYYGIYHESRGEQIGLMLEGLKVNGDKYTYSQRTSEGSKNGSGTLSSYTSEPIRVFKTGSKSFVNAATFGRESNQYYKSYVFNGTSINLTAFYRSVGVGYDSDASTTTVSSGTVAEFDGHRSGSIFIADGFDYSEARTMISLKDQPSNSGRTVNLSQVLDKIKITDYAVSYKVSKTGNKVIKYDGNGSSSSSESNSSSYPSAGNIVWDQKGELSGGLIRVKKDGKYGFLNAQNELVIPLEYEGAFEFVDGYNVVGVQKNGKQGYINKQNKVVIPIEFDRVFKISDGEVKVKKDGKFGFYSTEGKYTIKVVLDSAEDFKNGRARIVYQGKSGSVGKDGKPTYDDE